MGEANRRRKANTSNAGSTTRPLAPQHLRDFAAAGLRNQIEIQRRIALGGNRDEILGGIMNAVDIVHVTYPEPRIDHGIGYFIAKGVPLLTRVLGGAAPGPDAKMVSIYVGSREEAHALGAAFGDDRGSVRHG